MISVNSSRPMTPTPTSPSASSAEVPSSETVKQKKPSSPLALSNTLPVEEGGSTSWQFSTDDETVVARTLAPPRQASEAFLFDLLNAVDDQTTTKRSLNPSTWFDQESRSLNPSTWFRFNPGPDGEITLENINNIKKRVKDEGVAFLGLYTSRGTFPRPDQVIRYLDWLTDAYKMFSYGDGSLNAVELTNALIAIPPPSYE